MTAQPGGTAELYHEKEAPRKVKNISAGAMHPANAALLKHWYRELAYCRLMLQRMRGQGIKGREEYWREEAARAKRCVGNILRPTRKIGVVVYPGMRGEVDSWVRMSLSRPVRTLDAKREAGPDRLPLDTYDGFCSRCESIGHAVTSCPFDAADEAVRRTAQLRRERRARGQADRAA